MQYIQGYMVHLIPETDEVHRICHVWLNIKGSVLDFTINQITNYGFALERPYIMGEIPEGLAMIGFVETENTIKKLTKKFAKELGVTEEEWINFHYENSTRLGLETNNF